MSTLEITVQVRKDGQPFPGFPVTRRIEAPHFEGFDYVKEEDGAGVYENLPVTEVSPVSVLVIQASRAVTVRLAGQSTGGIPLSPGGIIIIAGGALASAPLASMNNVSGDDADVVGLLAGEAA